MSDSEGRKTRRRRSGFLDLVNAVLTLVVIGIIAAVGLMLFFAQQFYAPGPEREETAFTVERGNGLQVVAARLESEGLISNRFIFQFGAMALKKQGELKAGEFRIAAGAPMADILRELTEGRPIFYGVTVPEGFTAWQVMERINSNETLVGEPVARPAEGSILPQTYTFDRGTERSAVLTQMQEAMAAEVARIWANRAPDLPISSPEEMVVLASIVEKETGLATERAQVASVFVNRLRRGMRLQSDPTIIYGITNGEGVLGRGLRRSEIEQRTDYNTYQIDRLPPTPIANPGRESLEAVANPADTDYLYFVAAGAVPSDGHIFAETYAEHRRNVARYRQIVQEAAEAAEAAAARDAVEAEEAGQPAPQGQ
ncbi:UPF0755 protein [Devosia enhydra]|uniref:Endolytic murein transglycosylase n=1 Tax=Devosia enhydra TaxID=665118 RepID=A0A1K2HSF5_9HYPH|nr:endolytic transglycosylase MltG [Devosia enhydra]SFZ80872.1 UPF0755 protein [Devosia enhydra]